MITNVTTVKIQILIFIGSFLLLIFCVLDLHKYRMVYANSSFPLHLWFLSKSFENTFICPTQKSGRWPLDLKNIV